MLDKQAMAAAVSEAASTASVKSFDRLVEKTGTIAKLRLEFFDRIILLDGGTVALSVTLISSFAAKGGHRVSFLPAIIASWAAFFLSMMLALTRNWVEHNRLAKAETNNYLVAVRYSGEALLNFGKEVSGPSAGVEELRKVVDEGEALFKKEQKRHESLLFWTTVFGSISLACMLAGFAFLLIFAIKNISLL